MPDALALPAAPRRPGLPTLVLRSPKSLVGLGVLVVVIGLALLAPWIAPYPATEMHAADRFAAPGRSYMLGSDFFGRDLFSRILFGYAPRCWSRDCPWPSR